MVCTLCEKACDVPSDVHITRYSHDDEATCIVEPIVPSIVLPPAKYETIDDAIDAIMREDEHF